MTNIEEEIQRAIREGKFDHLPGKGKPLNLDDDANVDPEWRSAYRILKNAGYSLPWIELRREIEADIHAARGTLRRAWEWRRTCMGRGDSPASEEAEWQRAQHAFSDQVQRLNKRIRDYNLQTPSDKFQLPLLNADREIDRLFSS